MEGLIQNPVMDSSISSGGPTPVARSEDNFPTRARKRIVLACDPCRRKKVKCDGSLPCPKCVAARRVQDCFYGSHSRARAVKVPIARSLLPKTTTSSPASQTAENAASPPLPTTSLDNPVANKRQQELRAGIAAFNSDTHAYQFHGPSSYYSFVQRLYQRIRRQSHQPLMLEVQQRVPEGLRQWGVERQIFTHGDDNAPHNHTMSEGNMLPKDLGEAFISSYFNILHPQAPILVEAEVLKTWQALWKAPERRQTKSAKTGKEKSVLYMVLAIGARLLDHRGDEAIDGWAEHYYERSGSMNDVFEETSLVGTHLLTLKAIYAMQIGRSNWVFLYLGHAARCVMALGLHRSQVTRGSNAFQTRLQVTFWTIYYLERMTAMFSGRPTSLSDAHVDCPLPDDLPEGTDSRPTRFAYLRAMSVLAKVSDKIMAGNYTPNMARRVSELSAIERVNDENMKTLGDLIGTLPIFLHFQDEHAPIGREWQEVQRTCLGISYHITKILMFRPALIYVTFFDSLALAQESIGNNMNIQKHIDIAISSAKSLIALTHDTFFHRCPTMNRDGNICFFIVSACLTLLFEVLDSETSPAHANEVFQFVDRGLQCLDRITHIGSTTGRAISVDVMKIAKDALLSTEAEIRLGSNLVENFTWLNDNTFEDILPDFTTSWLHNPMGMQDVTMGNLGGAGMFTQDVSLSGAADPKQMALDLMGEGLRFADNGFDFMNMQR